MMTTLPSDLQKAAEFIEKHDDFLLMTHERPDGDAIGSIFGLLNLLRNHGKSAEAVLPDEIPDKYLSFLPSNYRTDISSVEIAMHQCCIILDTPNRSRVGIGPGLKCEQIGIPIILLDHHPDNMRYGQINVVQPEVSSTAELLFMLSKELRSWEVTPDVATLWMLGMVMDTGGFRFDNTSATTLRHAAELLDLKADHHRVMLEMFFSKSLALQQFEAELFNSHLRTDFEGRFAWIYIPETLIDKYRIKMRDTEGLIEILRSIRTADIVALIQRSNDGYKVSLRSKDSRYSVGWIARELNGGGHEMAAGGKIKNTNFDVAITVLSDLVQKVLNG
ncbi:MAG: bifunctional oligoribonuclease/PAP phosphatase NrnA [Victivallaceae bacterium]|nr:bifunctional oligoribonuclease/PAP phosphatase NrnA [Victivallaceae bacterium]